MIEVKRLGGIMNTDDRESDVLPIQHIAAKNVRFYGGGNGLTVQNVRGNILIPNSDLPSGNNQCNGAFFDQVKRRILWFNWNSNRDSGLYQYSLVTQTLSAIFICGVNSADDILNLSLDYPVHSMAIVYRTQGDGDLLYWTDGLNRPRYLNLDTVAAMSPFTEDMINAAKNAPPTPPETGYGNDATVTINNTNKKLFQFSYRWGYTNLETSTISPYSKVALPISGYEATIQNDPTKNNYINVTVIGGGDDYQTIEILGRESLGNTFGDFFLIDTLDRDQYNITPGSSFIYKFYNDGSYVTVGPDTLYFDRVPDKANTLELLNGNVIIYGGITEGYPKIERDEVDVVVTTGNAATLSYGPRWRWATPQRLGLIYFDDQMKTNGVISFVGDNVDTTDFVVTTPDYSKTGGGIIESPYIDASINHLPPEWATTYQWVRAALTPKFVETVTCDYQTDTDYAYLCIQNFYYLKDKNTGFIPSYEFTPGDRVKVWGQGSNGNYLAYDIQLDIEILGIVDREMDTSPNPVENGSYLKIKLPTVFPTGGFTAQMYISIYTPLQRSADSLQLFYEFGQKYGIYDLAGIRYHEGQLQNQTGSQPATFRFVEGDVYSKPRSIYEFVDSASTIEFNCIDPSYSDYFSSSVNSNGRGWVVDENAKEEYNPVLVRWGGKYQPGTNINELNRFPADTFDEVVRSYGDIRRFKAREKILRVFQDRGVGQYGVYARFIQNNQGQNELVTTDDIITTNNVNYYQGIYGLGGYPTNLTSSAVSDYFVDVITGREIRLGGDGITDLGLLYKGQFTLPQLVTPYNRNVTRTDGSVSKVMKFWDSFENQAHTVLQGGTTGGESLPDYNYSFNETRNAFCSFYDFHPEWTIGTDDIVFSWKDGQIYSHNSSTYCNFYGVQYNVEIDLVFNGNLLEKKSWQSVTEVANAIWEMPLIYTNVMSYGTQRQESKLIPENFARLEGNYHSAFFRDMKSQGGWINGGILKGNYIVLRMRKASASDLVYLTEISVKFADSPLTNR